MRFISSPTKTFRDAVKALEKLMEEEGRDKAERAFAAAVWEKRKEHYAKALGLKESGGHPCLARLIGKRCDQSQFYLRTSHEEKYAPCSLPAADDHASLWLKDGKPHSYVSQPYGMSPEDMRKLVKFCDEYGLTVNVNAWGSWWFPGHTLILQVRKIR
jgi:hypothetical protein